MRTAMMPVTVAQQLTGGGERMVTVLVPAKLGHRVRELIVCGCRIEAQLFGTVAMVATITYRGQAVIARSASIVHRRKCPVAAVIAAFDLKTFNDWKGGETF